MTAQHAIKMAKAIELRHRGKAFVGQYRVEREATMAFAQNAAVPAQPIGVIGVERQNVVIEHA